MNSPIILSIFSNSAEHQSERSSSNSMYIKGIERNRGRNRDRNRKKRESELAEH